MDDPLFREQTPAEYFKTLVESALSRQHLRTTELTEYYLVDLLCRFVRPDRRIPFSDDTGEPLALRLRRALESGGMEQRARLRNLGDFSLFTTGFFSDSLNRKAVDVDYYVAMGEYAYGSLGRRDTDAFGEVFTELARKFVAYMDVLADISERCIASVREVAANGQHPRRTAFSGPGRGAERERRYEIPSIVLFLRRREEPKPAVRASKTTTCSGPGCLTCKKSVILQGFISGNTVA
jgi:hypothetical protein